MRLTVTGRKVQSRLLSSPLLIMYFFAAFIAVGTLLLLLPFTQREGGFTPFMVAFFTATSAVTVTGLVIRDTASYWTPIGHVIILGLIFVGGIGFMTMATFLLIIIGQRVTLAQRLLVRETLGTNQLGGLVALTVRIVIVAIAIQVVGFAALFVRFAFMFDSGEAAWQAAFHSVSAFNNAGFDIVRQPGGFINYRGDPAMLLIIGALTLLGGISYYVMVDVVRSRRFSKLTLNSKLVLIFTGALLVVGTVVFLAAEYQNPMTLGPLPIWDKVMDSLFQSIIARTAGFTSVNVDHAYDQTNFFYTALMFIGGASASVAGGIKVNTFAVIVIAMLSTLRGRSYPSAFGREIPQVQIQRAMVIGAVSTAFVFVMALLLAFTESTLVFLDLLFEAISAFGTVGLSTGITAQVSELGKLILILAMFFGRLGPLTVGLALAQREGGDLYRYAQERVTIG